MTHHVTAKEVGMIRVYMKPSERAQDGGRVRNIFSANPLYRKIVREAKASGIMNAVAHQAHFGYSNHGGIQEVGVETPNPDLTICVELIAPRDQLEAFCRSHGALLKDKIVIYKHLEHWSIAPGKLESHDITPDSAIDESA